MLIAGCGAHLPPASPPLLEEPPPTHRRLGRGLPESGQWRQGFDLADLDGDGRLDLIHGPPRGGDGRPALFLGDGNGDFRRWTEVELPDLAYDYGDVAAADFDGDGVPDLAFGVHLGDLQVLRNDGSGRFSRMTGTETLAGFASRAVAAGDWNDDGRVDLAALGEGPQPGRIENASRGFRVYLNLSTGWDLLQDSGRVFGESLALADLDGDGRLDAATASNVIGLQSLVLLGDGAAGWRKLVAPGLSERAYFPAVATADFDADGSTDLAVAASQRAGEAWRGRIVILRSTAGGLVPDQGSPLATERRLRALDTGDLNADGTIDVVALDTKGAIHVWHNEGGGGFQRQLAPALDDAGQGCRGSHVRLADLDGSGRPEIIASFADENCPTKGSLQVWTQAGQDRD